MATLNASYEKNFSFVRNYVMKNTTHKVYLHQIITQTIYYNNIFCFYFSELRMARVFPFQKRIHNSIQFNYVKIIKKKLNRFKMSDKSTIYFPDYQIVS